VTRTPAGMPASAQAFIPAHTLSNASSPRTAVVSLPIVPSNDTVTASNNCETRRACLTSERPDVSSQSCNPFSTEQLRNLLPLRVNQGLAARDEDHSRLQLQQARDQPLN